MTLPYPAFRGVRDLSTLSDLKKELPMNWYMEAFRKYAQFGGRSRRMEFWMFTLINVLVIFGLAIFADKALWANILLAVYAVAMFIPCIALTVRRLHDTGRSGWWIFISAVPLIGSIAMIIFEVLPGDVGDNGYGPDPKGAM
jgi:uncharacterized membrane protein YhaH (DUF805 family)